MTDRAPGSRSGRGLLWLSAGLVLLGAMVGSPAGGVAILLVAALCALVPIATGPGGRRLVGAGLLVAALVLAIAQLPAAREHMARYRAHAVKGQP
ncbi:MAG: hypothetical protein ACE147_17455 [Candidatus Methylomirabilales bacterium]